MNEPTYTISDVMYEVPFVAWFSDKYKEDFQVEIPVSEIENRKYMLDEFIHSFADITQIGFEGYDASKSIFSEKFTPRPRIIKDSIDYDLR